MKKIMAMSLEELAEFLNRAVDDEREDWEPLGCTSCVYENTHHKEVCADCIWSGGIGEWLKREAE